MSRGAQQTLNTCLGACARSLLCITGASGLLSTPRASVVPSALIEVLGHSPGTARVHGNVL